MFSDYLIGMSINTRVMEKTILPSVSDNWIDPYKIIISTIENTVLRIAYGNFYISIGFTHFS